MGIKRYGNVWFDPGEVLAMEEFFYPDKESGDLTRDHLDIYIVRDGCEKKMIIYEEDVIKDVLSFFDKKQYS